MRVTDRKAKYVLTEVITVLDRGGRRHPRGQALPLMVTAMLSFFIMAALVADVGYWRYQQRMEQGAADSGAIAGANEIPYAGATASPSPIRTLAQRDAASNGYTDGSNGVTVQVNNPPSSGIYVGNANAVEVIVKKLQPSFFAGVSGFHSLSKSVSARAVALRGTATRNCIYAEGTLSINSATVDMPQCGINAWGGLTANQSIVTATSIGYNGYFNNSSTYPLATPAPAAPAADPCSSLPGCAYLKANPPTGPPIPTATPNGLSGYNFFDLLPTGLTMSPGIYPQGVTITAQGVPGPVTFSPGIYNFEGGINFNGNIPSVQGTGVTFVINNGFNINSGVWNVQAPSSGNYMGILFYSTTLQSWNVNTGPSGSFSGAIYLPAASINFDGTLASWTLMVGQNITLNSGSNINVPSSAFPGTTTKPASLAE